MFLPGRQGLQEPQKRQSLSHQRRITFTAQPQQAHPMQQVAMIEHLPEQLSAICYDSGANNQGSVRPSMGSPSRARCKHVASRIYQVQCQRHASFRGDLASPVFQSRFHCQCSSVRSFLPQGPWFMMGALSAMTSRRASQKGCPGELAIACHSKAV